MRRLVFGIAAVVVIVAVCLIAFSKFRPSAPLDQTAARDNNAVVLPDNYEQKPTKANRRYKLGVLFPFLGAPFWVNEAYGVLDQGKLNGVEIVWLSADGYDN